MRFPKMYILGHKLKRLEMQNEVDAVDAVSANLFQLCKYVGFENNFLHNSAPFLHNFVILLENKIKITFLYVLVHCWHAFF